jgi:hypothetical protein
MSSDATVTAALAGAMVPVTTLTATTTPASGLTSSAPSSVCSASSTLIRAVVTDASSVAMVESSAGAVWLA